MTLDDAYRMWFDEAAGVEDEAAAVEDVGAGVEDVEAEVREDWEQVDTHVIYSCPVFRAVHVQVCLQNCLSCRLV